MRRWRIRRRLDVPALIDLTRETYPGELTRPIRAEDEHNAADLDELEAEETAERATGAEMAWADELARLDLTPTVVVSVTGPGVSLDLSVTGPLTITRQMVDVALTELEPQ